MQLMHDAYRGDAPIKDCELQDTVNEDLVYIG